ncbi:DUF2510 domain-containing protein [Nocardioides sp. SLBN-35]|uniref:DUF2510 domain-containing protein n=1 Tax=Nocardioides sp. SLBN-35 TaxID=2768445 RepID=UPI00114F2D01|nr:DUF2510 domain-containing protein [Nocardioides sp. SLBN-35]TQK73350.1 uncharacterized protein DUF2510 [Nocardioides sp. SLBN-35]
MDEQKAEPGTPAGWYPDPKIAGTLRFWDGSRWTDNVAPMQPPPGSSGVSPQLLAGLVVAAAVVGLILSQQSVSVMSGSGIVWTGAAICAGASIVSWVVKATPTWARAICVIAVFLAVGSAIAVENQLNDRREEISNMFDQ